MRVLLRVLAPLLGLAIAVVGVLVFLEVLAAWLRPGTWTTGLLVPWPDWYAAVRATPWSATPVRVVAIVAAVVGLLLILIGLLARRADIAVDGPAPEVSVTTSPRVLARLVGCRVRSADDVADASVTASRRRVSVGAEAWTAATPELHDSVYARVEALLDELPLQHRPTVTVSTHDRRGVR